MEALISILTRLGTSVERLRYFIVDAFIVCILFLPALTCWTVIALGFFKVYDFQAKNLKTERVLMLDSQEFEQAVNQRIDELSFQQATRR